MHCTLLDTPGKLALKFMWVFNSHRAVHNLLDSGPTYPQRPGAVPEQFATSSIGIVPLRLTGREEVRANPIYTSREAKSPSPTYVAMLLPVPAKSQTSSY